MDLSFSEDQTLLGESAERFFEREYDFEKRRASLGSATGINPAIWSGLAELGILALPIDEDAGGLGLGAFDMGLVMAAAGRHLLVEPLVPALLIAGNLVARGGDAAHHARWLAPMIDGRSWLSPAHDERGPEVAATARRSGSGWLLSGAKSLAPAGKGAAAFVVSARDEAGALRVFVVPADADGLSVVPARMLDGGAAADLALTDTMLDADSLLPRADAAMLEACLLEAATAACWEAGGAMTAAFDQTVAYVKQREQFGRPLAGFQAVQHMVAEMAIACQEARAAATLAAFSHGGGNDARVRSVSGARVKVARAAAIVAKNAVQLHGGMGISDELPIASYFRKLRAFEALYGTTEQHLARYLGAVVETGLHERSAVLDGAGR